MYKHLYDKFSNWFHGGQVYFYSDPHFSDEEMVHLRKNYIGDEEQVKRINSKIGKNDTIVILGDIGNKEMLKKIRGYKVLLLGNHDAGATNYVGYADEIYEGPLFISEKLLISHEPISIAGSFNIHGHDHSNCFSCGYNVCAEHINYIPVSLKEIIESGVLKNIPSIHRLIIDNATDRKAKRENKRKKVKSDE